MKKTGRPRKKITLTELAAYLRLSPATISRALNGDSDIKTETRAHVTAAAVYKGYVKKNSVQQRGLEADPNGQVTMRDLANKLGMSVATVCRAIKRAPTVSEKTIARVIAAAEEMGYARNHNASNLVARNSAKEGTSGPTIYTIAKTLRISPATVSRAFSKTASIAPATRKRVLREAARVRFIPNRDATALKMEHGAEPWVAVIPDELPETTPDAVRSENALGKVVGILVPQLAHPQIMDLLSGVEEAAAQHGSQLVMINIPADDLPIKTRRLKALAAITDGLIYIPFSTSGALPFKLPAGRPCVLLGTFQAPEGHLYARIDQFHAISRATTLLLNAGCKHIVLIDTRSADEAHSRRRAGFLKAHFELNLMPFNEQIIRLPGQTDLSANLADHLHDTNPAADGLILIDRLPDHSEIRQLKQHGIVPENIVAIEMEAGPRDFHTPAMFNRLCYSYHELGKQAALVLMKKIGVGPDAVLPSLDLPGQLLPPTKPFGSIHNHLSTKDDHAVITVLRPAARDAGLRNISDV